MVERGRKPGFRMSDEHRVKIQNSNILNALIEHATGDREMNPSQVTAGLGLLRKVMPDLQSTDLTADLTHHTHEDWLERLGASGTSAVAGESAAVREGMPEDQDQGGSDNPA